MYYPLYNNPFYYPRGAYIPNMCSYSPMYENYRSVPNPSKSQENPKAETERFCTNTFSNTATYTNDNKNSFFSINDDRLEIFGISINIDDLIILVTLFFMFKENQIDYSIIIILALILFDQN